MWTEESRGRVVRIARKTKRYSNFFVISAHGRKMPNFITIFPLLISMNLLILAKNAFGEQFGVCVVWQGISLRLKRCELSRHDWLSHQLAVGLLFDQRDLLCIGGSQGHDQAATRFQLFK